MQPVPGIAGVAPYRVPAPRPPLDLDLRGNEGARPSADLFSSLSGRPELLRAYPDAGPLEARLAARFGVAPEQVLVTAGADDALDRLCRALLCPGRALVIPVPAFEMTLRYAALAGAEIRTVPWDGDLPTAEIRAQVDEATRLIVLTSPNNPTGAVVTAEDLRAVAAAAPDALVVLDLAYVEYADEDLTAEALRLPNVLVLRTFSKARGLAGLRVGLAVGPAEAVGWLRVVGAPYPVSAPSLALAATALEQDPTAHVAQARAERQAMAATLAELGVSVSPSQANFAFLRSPRAAWLADGMAGLGIGVRRFPGRPGLEDAIRLGCPGDEARTARVVAGLRATLAPDALLLDMDGVLVDVRDSYRSAIVQAAAQFGVTVSSDDIAEAKAAGEANNDWVLTRLLLARAGVDADLDAVTAAFEAAMDAGLWRREKLLVARATLDALAQRLPLGLVTGRPRADADRAIEQFGLQGLFSAVVCMEDAPAKPDPRPVQLALERLGARSAWMVGDTPDDLWAARRAGVVPIAVPAPGESDGPHLDPAARVLNSLSELLELLP